MPINLVADELTRFNLPLTSSFFEAQSDFEALSDFGHVRDNTRTGDALRALGGDVVAGGNIALGQAGRGGGMLGFSSGSVFAFGVATAGRQGKRAGQGEQGHGGLSHGAAHFFKLDR